MSAASSPDPTNLAILAALGIGAYWFMTRRAVAAPVIAAPAPSNAATNGAIVGQVLDFFRGLTGGTPLLGTYDGRAQQPWDVTPAGDSGPRFNNPSAYVSSAVDGVAFNPPGNTSAFNAVWESQGGYALA